MDHLNQAKAELRRRMRAARLALPSAVRTRETAAALALAEGEWLRLGQPPLAAYAALPGELDPEGLLGRCWGLGRPVWLPRVAGPGRLAWHPVAGPGDLRPGAFGIREPDPGRIPGLPLPGDALLIVPGTAFTRDGRRLGQGGGFYDRLLPDHPGLALGIGFTCQLVDDLPTGPHDRRLPLVILGGTRHPEGAACFPRHGS